ncbi:Hypothetical protein A7982_03423 [Minicystis rosea]|nr:Hypothetical protein A7982_03423 [Minicystis rosea]
MGAATLASGVLALGGCQIHSGPKIDLIGKLDGEVLVSDVPSNMEIPARADVATVVFVRPSSDAEGLTPVVLDEQGRFLGQSWTKSYFAVTVAPGEHRFVVCSDRHAGLRARLAAGKRYVVEIVWGGRGSGRMIPRAMRPGSEGWGELGRWYGEFTHFGANGEAWQAYVRSRPEFPGKCLRAADSELGALDEKALRERSLAPEDGE